MLGAQPTVLRYRVAAILAALLLDPVFRALCRTREGGRKGGRGSGEREDEIVYFDWRCSKKFENHLVFISVVCKHTRTRYMQERGAGWCAAGFLAQRTRHIVQLSECGGVILFKLKSKRQTLT